MLSKVMGENYDISSRELDRAGNAVYGSITPTPLTLSSALSDLYKRNIFLKWENKFRTGSFKERGAVNFLANLKKEQRKVGVCTGSAGNHALALSYHCARARIPCKIFMPVSAPLFKVQSVKAFGAEVILKGATYQEACAIAEQTAKRERLTFVPAFDHPWIVAGQSTCGREILEQCPQVDAIVAPIGGGGLISGIALAAARSRRNIFVAGIQSEWAARKKWRASSRSGIRPFSIADGIAVKQPGELTWKIIKKHVDRLHSVAENQIASAMVQFLESEKSVIEGAAAAAVAGLAQGILPRKSKNAVVVISGSNLDMNLLSRLLEREMGARGRLMRIVVSVPDRPGMLHITTGVIAEAGANVLQVTHDRSFSKIAGNVEITLLLEVRDSAHKRAVLKDLHTEGLAVREN